MSFHLWVLFFSRKVLEITSANRLCNVEVVVSEVRKLLLVVICKFCFFVIALPTLQSELDFIRVEILIVTIIGCKLNGNGKIHRF